MRFLLLPLFFLISLPAFAVKFSVQDPCSEKRWVEANISYVEKKSVGALSIETLEALRVPHQGAEQGINSIRDTVVGDDALEIISDSEMRAYGWCYHVNDQDPGLLPNKVFLKNDDDKIHWFFAFAHYKDGAWVSYCIPTAKSKPSFICKKP